MKKGKRRKFFSRRGLKNTLPVVRPTREKKIPAHNRRCLRRGAYTRCHVWLNQVTYHQRDRVTVLFSTKAEAVDKFPSM